MRAGVDDGGVLMLQHDGQSWVMLNLNGQAAYRNGQLAPDDGVGACRWAHAIVETIADVAPAEPGNAITDVRFYTFWERDGMVQAELSAGGLHHDGRGWVLVDVNGEVAHRNDGITIDDTQAASAWADTHRAPGRRPSWRSRLRVDVGRFPDGTYGDPDGRLGRQRLRRAWNRMLG